MILNTQKFYECCCLSPFLYFVIFVTGLSLDYLYRLQILKILWCIFVTFIVFLEWIQPYVVENVPFLVHEWGVVADRSTELKLWRFCAAECGIGVATLVSLSNTLNYGCVRLASLGRPRGAHSGEHLARANRTITHRFRSDVMHLGPAPKWTTPQAGHWGLTWVSPWNDVKAIRSHRGRPGSTQGS